LYDVYFEMVRHFKCSTKIEMTPSKSLGVTMNFYLPILHH